MLTYTQSWPYVERWLASFQICWYTLSGRKLATEPRGLNLCMSVKWRSHAAVNLAYLGGSKRRVDAGEMYKVSTACWWLCFLFVCLYLSNKEEKARRGLQWMSAPLSAPSCPWARHLTSDYSAAKGRSLWMYWAGVNVCNWMNLDQCVAAKAFMPSEFTFFKIKFKNKVSPHAGSWALTDGKIVLIKEVCFHFLHDSSSRIKSIFEHQSVFVKHKGNQKPEKRTNSNERDACYLLTYRDSSASVCGLSTSLKVWQCTFFTWTHMIASKTCLICARSFY